MIDTLPDRLRRNVHLYFGERGLRWLADLEERLPDLARTWDLHILPRLDDWFDAFARHRPHARLGPGRISPLGSLGYR